jgi:hypothetical protein
MKPELTFISKSSNTVRQTENLEKWWKKHRDKVLELMDYYVKCKWEVENMEVHVQPLSKRGSKKTTYDCRGEVDPDQPQIMDIFIGSRVRWTKNNLCVFIHELIHCATRTSKTRCSTSNLKKPSSKANKTTSQK